MKYVFKRKTLRVLAAMLDAVGWFLFVAGRCRESPVKNFRNILILRLDHLGDILPATAIPQLLKEHFGGCGVTFLTSSAGAALLKNNPFVDEVLVYDAPWFARRRPVKKESAGFWQTVRQIQKRKFDLALCLRGDIRENFLVFAGGVSHRVGYGVTGGGFFLTRQLVYREGTHENQHTLDILRVLGIWLEVLRGVIYFTFEEEQFLRTHWQVNSLQKNWATVQLKAGTEAKQWPRSQAEEFMALCAEKLPQQSLLFIGDSMEGLEWLSDFFKKNPSLAWKNLIGQTSLRELFWLIRQSRFFIGPDSGPTHVAASFGIPTLFLYSGTNEFEQWKSLEENADFLRNPVPCSPCHKIHCPVPGHPCMSGIDPEQVLRWILERSHE